MVTFSDVKNNETGVKIGKINVVLKEDWPEIGDVDPENPTEEYDEFGIKRYTKESFVSFLFRKNHV